MYQAHFPSFHLNVHIYIYIFVFPFYITVQKSLAHLHSPPSPTCSSKLLCFCFGHQVISLRGSPGGATTATAGSRQGRGHSTHRHSNRPHHAIWRIAHIRHAHACGHRWFARWCEGRSTPYIGDKLIPPRHRCMSNVSYWVEYHHPLPTGNQWQETQHM